MMIVTNSGTVMMLERYQASPLLCQIQAIEILINSCATFAPCYNTEAPSWSWACVSKASISVFLLSLLTASTPWNWLTCHSLQFSEKVMNSEEAGQVSSTWRVGSRSGLSKISQANLEFLKKGKKWAAGEKCAKLELKRVVIDKGWETAMKWASSKLVVTGCISQSICSHSSLPPKASLFPI